MAYLEKKLYLQRTSLCGINKLKKDFGLKVCKAFKHTASLSFLFKTAGAFALAYKVFLFTLSFTSAFSMI